MLNEATEAESICLDILQVEPQHQQALVMLLLALTDQFGDHAAGVAQEAEAIFPCSTTRTTRVLSRPDLGASRQGAARPGRTRTAASVYEWLSEAMDCYGQAEAIRPSGNDDAILRWNTCARILMRHPHLEPSPEERTEPLLLE